nr:MAG TPA: hypothetical protein [Crassvirales sp.]
MVDIIKYYMLIIILDIVEKIVEKNIKEEVQ